MSAPNPDDPLDNGVADMWKNREAEALRTGNYYLQTFIVQLQHLIDFFRFVLTAREWTARYAN